MPIPMYITSNGDLAREIINSVVTLLGTSTFVTAIRIATLFSIFGAGITYIAGHNIVVFARWFIVNLLVTLIMLGPKVNLQIIDSSEPGANYVVGNVPYGLAYPVSVITSIANGLVIAFESSFHMPDDLSYSKTGMLFGSKLFRLSTEFRVLDPKVREELDSYVRNCVLGDVLISKKYSVADLVESDNLVDVITRDTSNIRGIYIGNIFRTCMAARAEVRQHITHDINENVFKEFAKRIFGKSRHHAFIERFKASLVDSYRYYDYGRMASSALEIATQNILINSIRDGISNYAAETGATAAILNFSSSQAMDRMRVALATSHTMVGHVIPLMHTILLILVVSVFPIIVLLALQSNLTTKVLKNYFYTVIWIESWPLLFACLNLMITFYTKRNGYAGITISNIDQLALEHSDISSMAGYMMFAIPFISASLVTGMSYALNHSVGSIAGVMQSSLSSAATEAATGNIHLGNSSWNNINANKFDTSSTLMRGTATEQLQSGVLHTMKSDGDFTYDSSHAISKLPINARSSDLLSSSFSEQAEAAKSASIQDQRTYDESISGAFTDLSSFGKSLGSNRSIGENFSSREGVSAAQSASNMLSTAESIAKRNHVDTSDVFKGLVNFSQVGTVGGYFSLSNLTGGKVIDPKAGASITLEHNTVGESSTNHNIGRSFDITAEEASRFSSDLHRVEEYNKTSHLESGSSEAAVHLAQLSSDLREAKTASTQYSVHKAESDRLSSAASYVRQHSNQIDSDLSQDIAHYVVNKVGHDEAGSLFAGRNRQKLESLTKEYMHHSGIENAIINGYRHYANNVNPDAKYHHGIKEMDASINNITSEHSMQGHDLKRESNSANVGVNANRYEQMTKTYEANMSQNTHNIGNFGARQNDNYEIIKDTVSNNIKEGKEKSRSIVGLYAKAKFRDQEIHEDKKKEE